MASNNRVDIVYSPPQEERFDVSRIFNPRKVFAIFPEMNGTNIYGLMEDGLEKHGLAEKGANGYIPWPVRIHHQGRDPETGVQRTTMSFEYSPVNSRLGLSPHLLEIGVPILGGLNYMARSELHLKHLEKVGASSEHLQNVLRDTSTKINLMAILQFGEIIAGSTLAMVGHSLYQLLSK